jgi:hypothetical protein
MNDTERLFPSLRPIVHEGTVPSFRESDMSDFSSEVRELDIDQLESVSGGDMALDVAVKAYEALGKRLLDAVHQPVTQPTVTLHF